MLVYTEQQIIQQTKESKMEQTNVKQMEATITELLAKAEELKQLVEKSKKEETWPTIGDTYYVLGSCGFIGDSLWEDDEWEKERMEIGNVFHTKEDAKKALAKRKLETKLRKLAEKAWKDSGKELKWAGNNTPNKYHLFYDHNQNIFEVDENVIVHYIGQVFFPTYESAKDAVKEIGEDNLKLLFM